VLNVEMLVASFHLIFTTKKLRIKTKKLVRVYSKLITQHSKLTKMLSIKNLKASIGDKEILKGLSLDIKPGEVHAIMGPNGAGKSTLSSVLAGRSDYEVTGGSVEFLGKNLLEMSPEDRAREGVFLAFQYPIEIPGVSTTNFLKTAINEIRKHRGQDNLDAVSFLKMMKEKNENR